MERDDLTSKQKDYAIFLPAISGFYSGYVGKQRHGEHVEANRIPKKFENGIEGMNFLNPEQGYFTYKWGLYSAGHANLDTTKFDASEDMIRNRDPDSFILGDSGGFQIGKGVWEGDWRAGSGCAKAQKYRTQVLDWMESYMNYGMGLDIPGWVGRTERGRSATQISNYEEAVEASKYNFEYWIRHRRHNCKFLTVLQGDTHAEADQWYDEMKKYSDPKHFSDDHFNGWAMGSQNKCDMELVLKRLVTLREDGLLEKGKQDWIHYLGTSKLEWAMAFTDIQRAIRKYHNPNLTISFDCASPFLSTANGGVYYQNNLEENSKWSYKTTKCVDDKKYAKDERMFRDAVLQDGIYDYFIESPLINRTQINEICIYGPGVPKPGVVITNDNFKDPALYDVLPDLNKIDKWGRTSWDSFAYSILMGHNVYAHIKAVQDGNDRCDAGVFPEMLQRLESESVNHQQERKVFRDMVDAVFSAPTHGAAMKIIEENSKWYTEVVGSSANGYLGKKAVNANTQHNIHFTSETNFPDEKREKVTITPVFIDDFWSTEDTTVKLHTWDEYYQQDDSGEDGAALEALEAAAINNEET